VELPKLSLDKFTDSYFKAAEDKQKKKKGEDDFFKSGAASWWPVCVVCMRHKYSCLVP
jgi:hypothetical protein